MTSRDFKRLYLSLSDQERMRLLARVAFNLTVDARDTYVVESEEIADPIRLRGFNELQHRVLSHVSSLANGVQTKAEDEESFVDMVLEWAKEVRAGYTIREAVDTFSKRDAVTTPSKKVG